MAESIQLTIGQLARRVRVNIETVRFYERKGLINKPSKPIIGFRKYGQEQLLRIRFVKRAKELGFTLKEIKSLLSLQIKIGARCRDIKKIAQRKLTDIAKRIDDLQKIKSTLKELISCCVINKPTSECSILDALKEKG